MGLTPKGLCPKPKCTVSNHLIHRIQKASYSYSKQLIRICIEDFSSKFDKEDDKLRQAKVALDSLNDIEQIISVKRKVHNLNREVFNDFLSIKTKKLDALKPFKEVSQENKKEVVTIPEDLQLSHDERKVLSRGLSFIPVNQNFNKSNTQEDLQRFFRRVKLHAHFNDPDKPITNIDDNEDSLLNKYKKSSSSWTPSDVHPSINNFISRCKEDIDNINSEKSHTNITKSEYAALEKLKKNDDIVIKKADKGGAVVVWRKDLYILEGIRQFSNKEFYEELSTDYTNENNERVKKAVTKEIDDGNLTQDCKIVSKET